MLDAVAPSRHVKTFGDIFYSADSGGNRFLLDGVESELEAGLMALDGGPI